MKYCLIRKIVYLRSKISIIVIIDVKPARIEFSQITCNSLSQILADLT